MTRERVRGVVVLCEPEKWVGAAEGGSASPKTMRTR